MNEQTSEPIAPRTTKLQADGEYEEADRGALELRPQSQVQPAPSRLTWTPTWHLELPFQLQGSPTGNLRSSPQAPLLHWQRRSQIASQLEGWAKLNLLLFHVFTSLYQR